MIDYNVAVVVPAAGRSERFSGECSKQYCPVLGKPLFMHCVDAFINMEYIKKICVVSDRLEYVNELLEGKSDKILVVTGGPSRHESIKNGVIALKQLVVVVHDGARPVVPDQLLKELIVEANRIGAAGATRPLTSTIIRPDLDGFVDSCLDRGSHVASETPQAFNFEMLYNVYQKVSAEDLEHGTECLALVLKYAGVRAKLIPGPNSLLKVTEKRDCHTSAACLLELSTRVAIFSREENDIVLAIKNSLLNRVSDITVQTSNQELFSHCNTVFLVNDATEEVPWVLPSQIVLDPNTKVLIIQIILNHQPENSLSNTLEYFIRWRREHRTLRSQFNKDLVTIFIKSPDYNRFLRLVNTMIFNDRDLFAGEIFFI